LWLGLLYLILAGETGTDARRKVAPDVANGYAHSFTFKDLLVATGYFNHANFIGEGGFGKVYKGKINGQVSKNLFFNSFLQYRDRRRPMRFPFAFRCADGGC
jgi:hypothetical protein